MRCSPAGGSKGGEQVTIVMTDVESSTGMFKYVYADMTQPRANVCIYETQWNHVDILYTRMIPLSFRTIEFLYHCSQYGQISMISPTLV